VSIEDEVRRQRQQAQDEAVSAAEEARISRERAAAGQAQLHALGKELLAEFERNDVPTLIRLQLTPKLFSSGVFKISSLGDPVWPIDNGIFLNGSGLICGATGVWRPGDISTPQDRRRNSYPNSRTRAADEPGQCLRLIQAERASGLYETVDEIRVSGSPPSGYANREDPNTGIWFDGSRILRGSLDHFTDFRNDLLKAAAVAIVAASSA
jgi:hypothetical protein